MSYTPTNWVNKSDPAFDKDTSPAINAQNLNKVETAMQDAHARLDGLGFYVNLTGTKNGSNVYFYLPVESDFSSNWIPIFQGRFLDVGSWVYDPSLGKFTLDFAPDATDKLAALCTRTP